MKNKLQELQNLVEQFHSNIIQYKNSKYDEANTRVDFIDKFFELLDWDVRNVEGFSEDYRDVVREDKVIIQGKPKAPDYSFRIGKERKFFVEAKKPSVNIKQDSAPAYQVRRYGYTAKVPLSILTDFEEFAIYDTRIKPNQNDKASVARIFYCTYDEYEKNFEFIYNTFAKNSILKGSFDKYVIQNKNKKGTSEVDDEFLKLIENWRNNLAKNIALRNKNLSIYNLNTAIQKIIDRIIFLRIAEDRNMETYGTVQNILKDEKIYKNLVQIFIKADKKYNSGLFKQTDWLNELQIDDKILKKIIQEIYYPKSPYELSIMPIETLGNIYEQFLGKIIRLTPSHQAKVEEKPEVKKAGGVYYTPQYIVEYIVKNTVGEKIKNKSPNEIDKIKNLDPACGSGSFLVGTYQFLLDNRLKYYTKKSNIKSAMKDAKIYQVDEETFRLSIKEKKSILLNNIFGVDIDKQAVEVTKL
ncbi:MAG: N-6 DNA methylase, partial [Candidatus Marinimicrobia bacterium]|nr:N-6 DNA methylase [Candidatus Neomarinimicrobiota bacterium]